MHPSRRGLVLIGAGLVLAALPAFGLAGLWASWACFWALIVLLFGLDAALAQRPRHLASDLVAPDTLYVGGEHKAVLRLRWPRSVAKVPVEVAFDLSSNLEAQAPQRSTLAEGAAAFDLALRPTRRGEAELESAWVRYTGPFGLMVRSVRVPLGRRAAVVPNLPSVRSAALRFWTAREYQAGLKIERFVGDGTEFDSLREFLPGLDRRSIDWKASARHTKLLCRQFRAERSHQVVLAVDAGRLMAEPIAAGGRGDAEKPPVARLDHAVHAALLLAYFSARAGDRVSLFAFDERPRTFIEPRPGMVAFRTLLQKSAELSYSTAETNYTLALTNLMARLTRRSLVIVLTDFVDTVTAELMIENLYRLAKRHLVVFVALRDPLLGELTAKAPRTLLDLNRAVVADSLLRERELVVRKLVHRGVFCIDAPPAWVGATLVNRYLDVKRREMI